MFVIPCKFNKNNQIIFECIKSINFFHPEERVVVVDSNSDDKAYLTYLKNNFNKIEILDISNKNYVIGAFWKCLENYRDNFYYLLHDSMILKKNISFLQEKPVTSIRYFRSHYGVGGLVKTDILGKKYHYGYDTEEQLEWSRQKFNQINFENKITLFNGVFGSSFAISDDIIKKIKENNFHCILPENKWQDQAMERNLGIFFHSLGFNHSEYSLMGEHHEQPMESDFIKKYIVGRQ